MSNVYGRRFGIGRESEQLYNDELYKLFEVFRHIVDTPSGAPDPGVAKIDGALWLDKKNDSLKRYDKSSKIWTELFSKKFQITDKIMSGQAPSNPVRGQLWLFNDVLMYWNGMKWTPIQSITKDGAQFALSLFEDFTLTSPVATSQNLIVDDNQLDAFEAYLRNTCATLVDDYEKALNDQRAVPSDIPSLNDYKLTGKLQCLVPNIEVDRIFLGNHLDQKYHIDSPTCISYDRKTVDANQISLVHVNPSHLSGIYKKLFFVDKLNPTINIPAKNTEFYGFVSGSPYGDFLRPNSSPTKEDGDYQNVYDHIYLNDAAAEKYNYILAVTYEFSAYKSSGAMSHSDSKKSSKNFYVEGSLAPSEVFVEGFGLNDYDYSLNDRTNILLFNDNMPNLDMQMVHSNKMEYGFIRAVENHIVTMNGLHDKIVPCGIIQLMNSYSTPLVIVNGVTLHEIFGDYKYDRDLKRIYVNSAIKGMDWCVLDLYDKARDYNMFIAADTVKDTDNTGAAVIDYNPDLTAGERDDLQLFVDGELILDSDIRRRYSDREFIVPKSRKLEIEDEYMLFSNEEWDKHKVVKRFPSIDPDGKAYISLGKAENGAVITQVKGANKYYTKLDNDTITEEEKKKGIVSKFVEETEDPLYVEYASPKLETSKNEKKTVKSVDGINAVVEGDVESLSYTVCYLPTMHSKRGLVTEKNFRGEPVIKYKKSGGNIVLFVDGSIVQKNDTEYRNINEAEINVTTNAPCDYIALLDYTKAEKIVKLGGDPMNVAPDIKKKLDTWTSIVKSGTIVDENRLPDGKYSIPLKTGELDEDHLNKYYLLLNNDDLLDDTKFQAAIAYEDVLTTPNLKDGQKFQIEYAPSLQRSIASGDILSIRDVDNRLIVPVAYETGRNKFLLYIDGLLIDEDDVKSIVPQEKHVYSRKFLRNSRYFSLYEKEAGARVGTVTEYDENGNPCINIPRDTLFDDEGETAHAYNGYLFINDKLIPAKDIYETNASTKAYRSSSFKNGKEVLFYSSNGIDIVYGYISGSGATDLFSTRTDPLIVFADGQLLEPNEFGFVTGRLYVNGDYALSAQEYTAVFGANLAQESGSVTTNGQIQTTHDADYLSHSILFVNRKRIEFSINGSMIVANVTAGQKYSLVYEPSLVPSSSKAEKDDAGDINAKFYGRVPNGLEGYTLIFSENILCHAYIRNAIDDSKIAVRTSKLQYGDKYILCSRGYYRDHSGVISRQKNDIYYFSEEVIDRANDYPIVFQDNVRIPENELNFELFPITNKKYFYIDNATEGQSCYVVSYDDSVVRRIHKEVMTDGYVMLGTTTIPDMVYVDGILLENGDYSMDGSKLMIQNLKKGSTVDVLELGLNVKSIEGLAEVPKNVKHPVIRYAKNMTSSEAAEALVFVDGVIVDTTKERIDLPDQHRLISNEFASGNTYRIIEKDKVKIVNGRFETAGKQAIKIDIPQIDSYDNTADNAITKDQIELYLDNKRTRAITLTYNQNTCYVTAYGLAPGMEYALFEDKNLKMYSGKTALSPDGKHIAINIGMTLSDYEKENLMIFVEGFKVDEALVTQLAPGIYTVPGLMLGMNYSVVTNGAGVNWHGKIAPKDKNDNNYSVPIENIVSMTDAENFVELFVDGELMSKYDKGSSLHNYTRFKSKENGIYLEKYEQDEKTWKQLYQTDTGYDSYKEYYLFDDKAINAFRKEVDHQQNLRDPETDKSFIQPAIPFDSKKFMKDNITLIINGRRVRGSKTKIYGKNVFGQDILLSETGDYNVYYLKANNMSVTTNGLKLGQQYVLLRDRYHSFVPQNNFTPALGIGSVNESIVYLNNKMIGNNSIVDTYMSEKRVPGGAYEIKKFISDNSPSGTFKMYSASGTWDDIHDNQMIEDIQTITGSYVNAKRSVKVTLSKKIDDEIDIFAYRYATAAENPVLVGRINVSVPTKVFELPIEHAYIPEANALSVWVNGVRQYHIEENKDGRHFSLDDFVVGCISYTVETPSYGNDYVAKREILTSENTVPGTTNVYQTKNSLYPGRIVVYVDGLRQPQESFKILDNNTIVFSDPEAKLIGNQYNYPIEKMNHGKSVVDVKHEHADSILIEVRPDTDRKENTFYLNQTSTNFRMSISEYDLPSDILSSNGELLFFMDGLFLGISEGHGYEKDSENGRIVFNDNDIISQVTSDPLYSYLILHPDKMNAYKKTYGEARKPEVKTITIDWN